jgi:lipopolysaccharide export system protein LptC
MPTFRKWLLGLLLFTAVGFGIWSIPFSRSIPTHTATNQSTQPDAVMENVVATIINKQGHATLKIETTKMSHYAAQDTTEIIKPHVTVYRKSPNPWYIDANSAHAEHGTSQITFKDNVVIHHLNDVANPTTTMKTASLTIFPNKQIAQTGDPVTLLQPDTTIHAIGMLANLGEGTVKLLSQAQGEYEPST